VGNRRARRDHRQDLSCEPEAEDHRQLADARTDREGDPAQPTGEVALGASVEAHYDIGNDLYTRMLDERMVYTCAYWKNATTLAEAQEAKLDLVCRKIDLRAGMHMLDLGCGWGGFASWAAEKYGCSVVGVTLSHDQVALGNQLWGPTGKKLDVELRPCDYRDGRR
jgi:cyclopropane fatty-acyl-phospholipid synthase-like methyltransferase